MQLGFDLKLQGPIQFLDRYLQILDLEGNYQLKKTALSIMTLQQFDDEMLDYNVSQIAAVSVLMSMNIVKISEIIQNLEKKQARVDYSFFKLSSLGMPITSRGLKEKQFAMNLDLWNTARVASMTGYSIEMLKPCMKKLIKFIR